MTTLYKEKNKQIEIKLNQEYHRIHLLDRSSKFSLNLNPKFLKKVAEFYADTEDVEVIFYGNSKAFLVEDEHLFELETTDERLDEHFKQKMHLTPSIRAIV